jgi:hypothetical protein
LQLVCVANKSVQALAQNYGLSSRDVSGFTSIAIWELNVVILSAAAKEIL